ncbi:MAG TPA: HlyD family efflux transporter periplasmic adaptor subunit [Myxococcota bacterium]|nr:HlyD family efflux transporter periplasmic adaptor subunit [Myxococcota bacterium]
MSRPFAITLAAAAAVAAVACSDDREPSFVGTLERDRIELIAEASEPIVQRAVAEGDSVKAGDLVLRLDDERLAALVAQAEHRRAAAAARIPGAESALTTAERVLARIKTLHASGVAAPEALDRARAQRDAARAERDAARAEVSQSEAVLAEARVHAERLEVRAPRDATVDALPYELGERPPTGAVVAVLLADDTPYARVYVPEPVRARVVPGARAAVKVDGVKGAIPGRVRTVSQEAAFTPYYALTERDRGRLAYVAKIDLEGDTARALPTGLPLEVELAPTETASRE